MPSIRPLVLTAVVVLAAPALAWAQPTLARDRVGRMPDAIRPFVDQLYSADPRQRAEGACQLGERPAASIVAIPILVSMLADDVAVPAIECDMSPWLRRELQVNGDARRWSETSPAKEAAEALGEIGDPAVPALLRALGHTDWKARKFAARAFGEMDVVTALGKAVAALGATLRDDHPEVRDRSAWALGELEEPSAVPMLVGALTDSDPAVRSRAVWALGEIEDVAAVPGLVIALKDGDAQLRSKAAWALGEIEDGRAVPALVQALKDPHWEVRKMSAWALGEIEDASAIEPLQAARYDTNVKVREAVMHALRELRDQY